MIFNRKSDSYEYPKKHVNIIREKPIIFLIVIGFFSFKCMKELIIRKVLDDHNHIVKKYLSKKEYQKYFTKEEQDYISNLPGKTLLEKLESIIPNKYKKKTKKLVQADKVGYVYKGIKFYNIAELVLYIYSIENNIKLIKNTKKVFTYSFKNKKYKFYPDFIIDKKYIKVFNIAKEDLEKDPTWESKLKLIEKYNIKVLYQEDLKACFNYIYGKYGKNYLKQFKKKQDKDFKRKILEIFSEEDIDSKVFEKRNSNIKIKFTCERCNCVDYQSPKTILHFHNLLCGSCRRKLLKSQN